MPKITEELFNKLFIVYAIIFFAAVGFNWIYSRRIRLRHPDTWAALGSPMLFSNNSISNGLKSTNFLIRKRYEELGDPGLNFYGRWARLGVLAIIAFLSLFLVLMLVGQFQNGIWKQPAVVSHPLNWVGGSTIVLLAALLASYALLTRRIRSQHPELWVSLGQPSFLNNTISNSRRLIGFVWSGGRTSALVRDAWLTAYLWMHRFFTIACAGLWSAVLIGALHT